MHERQLWRYQVELGLSVLSLLYAFAFDFARTYAHIYTRKHTQASPALFHLVVLRLHTPQRSYVLHSEYASPVNASPPPLSEDRTAHMN